MQTILVVSHLFLAIGLIGLILIQHGKGADMGAAFGSGASGTVFGAKGSASFLTRLTAALATLFFITSMVMAYFASQRDDGSVVLDALQQPAAEQQETQPQNGPTSEPVDAAIPLATEPGSEGAVPPATEPASEGAESPTTEPASKEAIPQAADVKEPPSAESAVPAAQAPQSTEAAPEAEQGSGAEPIEATPVEEPAEGKE
jgi:preprotein translocase subunit SecG